MKKTIISLSIIGVVSVIAIGATVAYFNDTETSTGNIFTAGSLDLKVDHVAQTYNDIDCKTCDVSIVSDTSNQVVATLDGADPEQMPHDAVEAWVHPVWVDPPEGADWIWATYPTLEDDAAQQVMYAFENEFEWYGPITGTTIQFSIASDNSVKVFLNGTEIYSFPGEKGYAALKTITGFDSYIDQGLNVVRFEVTNHTPDWAPGPYQYTNPGGLVYKLTIDGDCEGNYFKEHCSLWGEKDLEEGDTFFDFEDIKPGDQGTNIVSLHVYDNDAYSCLIVHDVDDQENVIVDPEAEAGDATELEGELSGYITMFAWEDANQNNSYDDGENVLLEANSPFTDRVFASLIECETKYVGIAWCAGTQSVTDSTITCDGSTMGDIAQTDILTASLTAYVEQQRNNSNFDCSNVQLED